MVRQSMFVPKIVGEGHFRYKFQNINTIFIREKNSILCQIFIHPIIKIFFIQIKLHIIFNKFCISIFKFVTINFIFYELKFNQNILTRRIFVKLGGVEYELKDIG